MRLRTPVRKNRRAFRVVLAFSIALVVSATLTAATARTSLAQSPSPAGKQSNQETGKAAGNSTGEADAAELNSLLAKGEAAMNRQDYPEAVLAYRDYLSKKPDDAAAHFQLGYAFTAQEQTNNARAEYEKATQLDPTMGEAFLNLGLSEVGSDPTAALVALRRAVELMPGDAHPRFMLGAALDQSGKSAEAVEQYKAALAIDGDDASIHAALANALLRMNRASDAEPEFRAALAIDADDTQTHFQLAECLIAEHKMDDAAAEFAAYLKTAPDDSKTRFAFVSMLIDLAKYDEALGQLDRGGAPVQQSVQGLKLRYEALSRLKRDDEALAVLLKAESLAPGDAEIHKKLGQTYLGAKNYPAAAREFQSVLKSNPGDEQTLEALATADYAAADCVGGLEAIDLQAKHPPLSPPSLFMRASCYDKLGRKAEAISAYDAFLAANKDQTSDMYFAATERARELRREPGNRK